MLSENHGGEPTDRPAEPFEDPGHDRADRVDRHSGRRVEELEGRLQTLPARVGHLWQQKLSPSRRAAVVSWASFAGTWGAVRGLTHWIRRGHGPSGGGFSLGGEHFHHYNLGIAGLEAIGAVATFTGQTHRRQLATAAAYGLSTALIVDEAALLLDLQDVYWAKQGRTSVDLAVGIIGVGGVAVTGAAFWSALGRELSRAWRAVR